MPRAVPPIPAHPAARSRRTALAAVEAAGAAPLRVPGRLPLNEALIRAPRRHDAGPAREAVGDFAAATAAAASIAGAAPARADVDWTARRLDEDGRLPARDLAGALGPLPALHATALPGLLIVSAPGPGRPGTLRLSGIRLTIPYAVRRLTGIAAPGSVVMAPLPGGAWAVVPADRLTALITAAATAALSAATGATGMALVPGPAAGIGLSA